MMKYPLIHLILLALGEFFLIRQ